MLDDFSSGTSAAARGRFGASLALSAVVYGGLAAMAVTASAVARHVIAEEELVQVEFAPPPEPVPEPPPPPPPQVEAAAPPPAAAPARLGRPRPQIETPTEIPEERPRESEAPLPPPPDNPFAPEQEGDPNGSPDGVIGGRPGGTGTSTAPEAVVGGSEAPAPARPRGPVRVIEGSTPPQVDREEIVRNFVIPPEVRSAGVARITVVVRVTVDAEGRVTRVDVLRGHPLIPNENITRAVESSSFQPARMADGTAYAAIHTLPITIAITL